MSDFSDSPLELLKRMGRVVTPVPSEAVEAERRRRISARVDGLLDELRERDRRALRGRLWAALAAAALVVLAVAGASLSSNAGAPEPVARIRALDGDVVLLRDGQARDASSAPAGALHEADELRTASSATARLALESRARIEVAGDTTLSVRRGQAGAGERIYLRLGRVDVEVPESKSGPGLRVETPDALVTVHGTLFSVEVRAADSAATLTRVSVVRSRVEVESHGAKALLGPGAEWSSRAAPAEPGPAEGGAPAAATERQQAPHESPREPRGQAKNGATRSTLAEENLLYERALAEARRGDSAAALAGLARLIRTYPQSPLLQNASVERFRILRRSGDTRSAAREAARYLAQYPSGFAREEAELVVEEGRVEAGR